MKNRVRKGSITVFLSLLLVLLISVVTVSLESAHLSAVRSQVSMESEAAMSNLFSHFEKSLYEKYELLFVNDRLNFTDILKEEMKDNKISGKELLQGGNHLYFRTDSIQVSDSVYLMDQDGKAFQEEINQILASDVIAMVKQSITGYIKQLSQSGTVTDYMNEIMEQSSLLPDMMEQVSQAAGESETTGNGISELKKRMDSCVTITEEYKKSLGQTQEGVSSLDTEQKLKEELHVLADKKKKLEKSLEGVLEELEEYEKSAEKITGNLEEIREGLQEEELEDSYKETLYGELKSVFEVTSESGSWYQQLSRAKEDVEKNLNLLRSTYVPSANEISSESILNGKVERDLKHAADVLGECSAVDIPVGETVVENKYSISARSLVKTVQKLITDGTFSIIVDNQEKLSKREIDMAEMPSQNHTKEEVSSGKNMFQSAVDYTKDTLSLNIYLTEYMDCYTDGGTYDLEYILGKGNSDTENLKSSINQLVLLRQAMNLVYLLTDAGKRSQAQTAAAGMLAITGNGALIQGLSMIILTAWAYAEAVSDVRILANHGKVDFIKNSNSWRLSLEQAADYRNWIEADKTQGKSGMNYQEYLRILLFFHSRSNNMFRGLDMVQWNICQADSEFRISQCVYAMDVNFSLCVRPIFFSVQNLTAGKSGYMYEHKEQESYG